jgi:hypothetical protein
VGDGGGLAPSRGADFAQSKARSAVYDIITNGVPVAIDFKAG